MLRHFLRMTQEAASKKLKMAGPKIGTHKWASELLMAESTS